MSKEKKKQMEEAAEQARQDALYEAKIAAKNERKKVEKTIAEIDKSLSGLMTKAADAKAKGYNDVYRQCVTMIKVAKGRKMQAEKFLFQMDAMQEIQNIADSSSSLLASMGNIMNTLGKVSLDKNVMQDAQKNFMQAQRELDMQSNNIERFMGAMEMQLPEDEMAQVGFSDDDIDAEIDAMLLGNAINNATVTPGAAPATAAPGGANIDNEMDYLKKLSMS
jgi:predicted  nucleic acid-binding Zn-ribbon protein